MRLEQRYEGVDRQLEQLARLAADETQLSKLAACSGWTVQQHVEHLLLAGEVMVSRIEEGVTLPPEKQLLGKSPKPIGRMVLLLGRIPRAKGNAPDFTVPQGMATEEIPARFQQLIERARMLEAALPQVKTSRHQSLHPVLGYFTPAQWLAFLNIHQQHHLNIIDEILRG